MKGWDKLAGNLFGRRGQTATMTDLGLMMKEGHELLKAEEYEKAQRIYLRMAEFRERLLDEATIEWILTGLAATWLLRNRFDEQIAFFSEYLHRYPNDCAAYCERAGALWYCGDFVMRLPTTLGQSSSNQPICCLAQGGGRCLPSLAKVRKSWTISTSPCES